MQCLSHAGKHSVYLHCGAYLCRHTDCIQQLLGSMQQVQTSGGHAFAGTHALCLYKPPIACTLRASRQVQQVLDRHKACDFTRQVLADRHKACHFKVPVHACEGMPPNCLCIACFSAGARSTTGMTVLLVHCMLSSCWFAFASTCRVSSSCWGASSVHSYNQEACLCKHMPCV